MTGLADYVRFFPCPYPSIVDEWAAIPAGQVAGFQSAPESVPCCREGNSSGGDGLGALTMDGSGFLGTGLFSGGTNLSTWGLGEVAVVGAGVYTLSALIRTGKSDYGKARARVKRGVGKGRKAAQKASSDFGGALKMMVFLGVLGGGAYLLYQQSQKTAVQ